MVDLGPTKTCLGIQIDHNNNIIRLSQAKYISELLHKYNMSKYCKPQPTPSSVNIKLLQQMSPQNKADHETMAQYPMLVMLEKCTCHMLQGQTLVMWPICWANLSQI